ncbi:MAG: cyclic pyranopterin monophosphate synthase MoaC [Thermoplasmata archaeon]|nr:MAG: cyclic pyranopterin monophosphate synthase MoaC [Thermoplasmata archaeon]
MIDVSDKKVVGRTAEAQGHLKLKEATIEAIKASEIKKGDPFKTAEAAALTGIKTTFMQIPHCHPIPITGAEVSFEIKDTDVICKCKVGADYKTGVEMEALVGVTTALLTVWDMVKYLEKDEAGQYPFTVINEVRVIKKQKEEV